MVRSVWCALVVVAGCNGSDDGADGEPTCEDLGVSAVDGTLTDAHDACVVSPTSPSQTLSGYLNSLKPLEAGERYVHERCWGVDDNLSYEHVAHFTYDDLETHETWAQADAIFDGETEQMVWLATSSRGTACTDDTVCADCCPQSCCEGEPVSGSGSGEPVRLRDCVLVAEMPH